MFEYRIFRSSLLQNVKWLVEACSKWRCQDNFLIHYLTSQSPHLPNNPLFQTTPLPFSFRAPPMPGLRWRNPQLSHITLRPGGGGRIYTPYNYIWKPSRSWFRARSKKSPWGRLHIIWPRFYPPSGMPWCPCLRDMVWYGRRPAGMVTFTSYTFYQQNFACGWIVWIFIFVTLHYVYFV